MKQFTISRAAKAANVNVETVRFYERKGLIQQPPKPEGGGLREYDDETVSRIRFVRQAQEIGFSLREIAELLSLRADPDADCGDVCVRAIDKRAEVQTKLLQLEQMRDALDELIASCPGGGDVKACTILDAMQRNAEIQKTTSRKGQQKMKTTILNIEGMHCGGCARSVEKLLSQVAGVEKADASFDERQARVLHDQDTASVARLEEAVNKGGFTAKAAEA